MIIKAEFEATGRYYVGRYGLPIFNIGLVHWPIVDPQGMRLVTVIGHGIDPGPNHAAQEVSSREDADKLVELLNRTLS